MRGWAKNRFFAVLTTACYTAAVTVSVFFHHHAAPLGAGGGGCCDAHAAADHDADCPVCQFLSHKPAPVNDVPTTHVTTLFEKVATAAPVHVSGGVFAAWQSRAPPAFA